MARGDYRHVVTFQNPGAAVPDGDGSFTQTWTDLATWPVSVEQASARDLERVAAGTVLSAAAYLVRGDFHPDVTTLTRMQFNGRTLAITGKHNVQERDVAMELIAVEQVT